MTEATTTLTRAGALTSALFAVATILSFIAHLYKLHARDQYLETLVERTARKIREDYGDYADAETQEADELQSRAKLRDKFGTLKI